MMHTKKSYRSQQGAHKPLTAIIAARQTDSGKGNACRSEEEERSTYPDEAVMEVQADEAGGDAAVVLEGGSHRLLHQGLRRWA